MSDPLTNSEVEDVLASIRRLVSDDKRQDPKSADAAVTDRLVLTPSLRVMDEGGKDAPDSDADSATDVSDAPEPEDAETQEKMSPSGDAGDDVVTDAFAFKYLMDRVAADVADENADASPTPMRDDGANSQEDVLADVTHDVATDDVSDNEDDSTVCDLSKVSAVDGDHKADLQIEDSISDADLQEWPSVTDGTPDAQHDLGEAPADDDPDDVDAEHDSEGETPFAMGEATAYLDGVADMMAATAAKTLGEKVATLETMVAKGRDNFEPDDTGMGANAGTEPPAMEWEDAHDDATEDEMPAPAAFLKAPVDEEPEETAAQIFASDEDVLDEEALRELVSSIVREELQGALGERITRNVRKLVRREIHRAMAAQDLE